MSDNISIAHLDLSRPLPSAPRRHPVRRWPSRPCTKASEGASGAAQRKAIVEAVRRMLRGRAARQLSG